MIVVVNIKNNSDVVKDVSLKDLCDGEYDKNNIECTIDNRNSNLLFDGLKITTNLGGRVDNCFRYKTIIINDAEICVADWFNMAQSSMDFVNIGIKIDYFEKIKFSLNPNKKIELHIPLGKCKLKN